MARVIRKFPIKCEIHFNAVVLLALTSFFTLQSNQDQWLDSLEAEYLSHIFSVSKLVPARTQFNYQGIIPLVEHIIFLITVNRHLDRLLIASQLNV